jgi:hypothetical protein
MRLQSLPPFVVMRELTRMLALYARPKYWAASDEEVAKLWADVLEGITEAQLVAAVTLYIRGDHRFLCTAGQMRSLAMKQPNGITLAGSNGDTFDAWHHRGGADAIGRLSPCPACGRAWQAHPRVTLVHDHSQHRAAGVACVGCCDEPACLGTYQVPPKLGAGAEPGRLSAGTLWLAPEGWRSDLRASQERREQLRTLHLVQDDR